MRCRQDRKRRSSSETPVKECTEISVSFELVQCDTIFDTITKIGPYKPDTACKWDLRCLRIVLRLIVHGIGIKIPINVFQCSRSVESNGILRSTNEIVFRPPIDRER